MNNSAPTRSDPPARAESLSVDGLALTRRVRPGVDPSSPLIVLVHGAMDRSASFGRVMRRLSEFEVVSYDRRGYGHSDAIPTDRASVADHGKDLLKVVDFALAHSPLGNVDRTAVVVGHSLGGTIALWLTAQTGPNTGLNPRRGTGGGPIEAVGAYESPAPWLDESFDSVGGGAVEVARTEGNSAAALHFYRMMIGESTFSSLRERDLKAREREGDALVGELKSLRDPSQAFELSVIDVPVTLGMGSESAASMTKGVTLMEPTIPFSSLVVIEGAGHGVHLSRPDSFADYVRTCVESSSTSPVESGS